MIKVDEDLVDGTFQKFYSSLSIEQFCINLAKTAPISHVSISIVSSLNLSLALKIHFIILMNMDSVLA